MKKLRNHLNQFQNTVIFCYNLEKNIVEVCKLRITAFKESEAKKYDIKISDLSKKAI